jgi:baculoviral IAP repeat-containing protein 2/3
VCNCALKCIRVGCEIILLKPKIHKRKKNEFVLILGISLAVKPTRSHAQNYIPRERLVPSPPCHLTMNMVQDSAFLAKLMKSADTFELKYDFSCELYRLSTYSAFPRGVPVSERSLARAGFYYTGANDKVKCFCCGLMLDNWKQGDSPMEKHRKLYPSCNFVQTLNPANSLEASPRPSLPSTAMSTMPLSFASSENTGYFSGSYSSFPSDPVNFRANQDCPALSTSPYHFAMNTEKARLLTYETWPLSFLSPAKLAKAGFYYIGPGDRVACFACDGKLSNWERKDDAMSEHQRHFPSCPFLKDLGQSASRYTVSNLSMQTHAARIRTFSNWPSSALVHSQELASAGFYYTGKKHSENYKDLSCVIHPKGQILYVYKFSFKMNFRTQ